jgi:hypothetical protein
LAEPDHHGIHLPIEREDVLIAPLDEAAARRGGQLAAVALRVGHRQAATFVQLDPRVDHVVGLAELLRVLRWRPAEEVEGVLGMPTRQRVEQPRWFAVTADDAPPIGV